MKKRLYLRLFLCFFLGIAIGGIQIKARGVSLSSRPGQLFVGSRSLIQAGNTPSQEKRAREKRIDERPRQNEEHDLASTRKTWVRTYGDPYSDAVTAVQITGDGGCIVVGSSRRQTDVTILEALVLKLSSNGAIEWQYAYPGVDEASSVRQTPDGGYIVSGTIWTTDMHYGDFWLLKLDAAGGVEWQRVYGLDEHEHASLVWTTSDGGYIVAGTKESYEDGAKDAWILRLSSGGQIEWQRRYGGADDEVIECIRQTDDGGYIAAGHRTPLGSGLSDFLVLKLTSAGSVEWQKAYNEDWDEEARSIHQTGDGGYLVAGQVSSKLAVLKLSPTGDIEWLRTYYGRARLAKPTADGGSIVVGTLNSGIGGNDIYLLKFSSAGDLEWQKIYGGGTNENQGVDVEVCVDGGYVVAGQTWSFGAGDSDILILRLDPSGEVERFPEIAHVSYQQPADSFMATKTITPKSKPTSAVSLPAEIPWYSADKKTWLIFSPPYLSGKRVLNRSLSQAEYVDVLTWEPNPNNSDLNIVCHRLYLYDSYHPEKRLVDLRPNERTFLVRDVAPDAWHTYSLAGITDKGEEGMRRVITIKETGWQLR
jgi:hypothetical protein